MVWYSKDQHNKKAIGVDRRSMVTQVVLFLLLVMLHPAFSMVMTMKNRQQQKQNHNHHCHTQTSKTRHYKQLSSSSSASLASLSSSRRRLLLQSSPLALAIGTTFVVDQTRISRKNDAIAAKAIGAGGQDDKDDDTRIYRFTSGLQFRNLRIGKGPIITRQNYTTVVIQLRAMTRTDGLVLFDTRDSSPILYGFQQNPQRSSKVTEGVEDAILSRGISVETTGQRRVEPMREGGIRKVIVPSSLAYGHDGVSRYDAYVKLGLNHPVPRDEVILYEIEILRCLDVEIQRPSTSIDADNSSEEDSNSKQETATIQACCVEEKYPCKGPEQQKEQQQ